MRKISVSSSAGAFLVTLFAGGSAAGQDTLDWSGSLKAGDELEVTIISGNVRALPAPDGTAEVSARKRGRSRDFDDVEIRVVETSRGIEICALYGVRAGGDDCEPDHNRHRGRSDREIHIQVSVDVEVRLPAGVQLVVRTISANVVAEGLSGTVDAATVSGDVIVSTSEMIHASSVSGSLELEIHGSRWDDLSFSTVSGDVTVYLPDNIDTDVRFNSLSGDLQTDFDMKTSRDGRRGPIGANVRGTIGAGGRILELKTVSGNAEVRRLR